jgi:hypothetical protein
MTLYSPTASCGKGLPRLESWPLDAALEHVVLLAHAVDEDVDAVGVLRAAAQLGESSLPVSKITPGTVSANDRKLRLACAANRSSSA